MIIPAHRSAAGLELVLSALARQTLDRSEFEIIVVDGGPEDLASRHADLERDVTFVRYDGPASAAGSRNRGAAEASGSVLLFADSDVVCAPDVLALHLAVHKEDPDVVLLGYVNAQESTPGEWSLRTGVPEAEIAASLDALTTRLITKRLWPDRRHALADAPGGLWTEIGGETAWAYGWTTLVSVSRDRFQALDDSFPRKGGEDLEWSYRLLQSGLRMGITRPTTTFHFPHPRDRLDDMSVDVANYYRMLDRHRALDVELAVAFDCGQVHDLHSRVAEVADRLCVTIEPEALSRMVADGPSSTLLVGARPVDGRPGFGAAHFLSPGAPRSSTGAPALGFLGCALPFPDDHFARSIVFPSYLALPDAILARVLQELLRVSRSVHVLSEREDGAAPAPALPGLRVGRPYWSRRFYCAVELDEFVFTPGHDRYGTTHLDVGWKIVPERRVAIGNGAESK